MTLALGCASVEASALALGRLNVLSTLGEPLRAEIDVTEISAAEAEGLRVNIGSPESFRAAGIIYSAALADVRAVLQKRADGRYVVRLNGTRSMNDPFLDLLLEANWSSGRIIRDYTVLLDPPATAKAAVPVNPNPVQIAPAPPQRPTRPLSAPAVAVAPVMPVAPVPKSRPAQVSPAESAALQTRAGDQVTVQRGDTASKIATAYKPADVSLDQMLVALLRGNPDAFTNGNVNRLKAGAILSVPGDSQARTATPDEASRIVRAQSNDFGDYRRRLAENAPTPRTEGTERQASGKLQASVEERNASAASPDRLKISQGSATAMAADEKLAQTRQAQATSSRADELAKNLNDLKNLQSASSAATPAVASASSPTTSGIPAVLAVPAVTAVPNAAAPVASPVAAIPAAAEPASSAASGSALPAASAPGSAASSTAKIVGAAPVVVAQSSFMSSLTDNPLVLGAAGLVAALLAFLLYRVLKRRRPEHADSVFLESKVPRDSFFGVSGGQQVDTTDRNSSMASSLSYSPSQLDSSDVDPVAEADVYLAYGRDLQAEEILREAMRTHPDRVAIPLKLLEIHAKRRDLRAFEALTNDIHKLTRGTGADWTRAVELGRDLDPGNPLYQTDASSATEAGMSIPSKPVAVAPVKPVAPLPPPFMPSVAPLNFDLDFPEPVVQVAPKMHATPSYTSPTPDFDDFDTVRGTFEPLAPPPVVHAQSVRPPSIEGNRPDTSGPIEFDMDALTKLPVRTPGTLEMQTPHTDSTDGDGDGDHPHAIKLSLARELQSIGDTEGARSLVEEVASEGSGELQAKARQLLTQWTS